MSIFSCVFQDQKNEFVLGKRTLNGSLLKMDGSVCGHYSVEAFPQRCRVHISIESSELQVDIRKSMSDSIQWVNKLFMPWGKGNIILNGKNIAQYISYGEIKFEDPKLGFLKIIQDDSARRFLWARAQGCSYDDANKFRNYRETLLVSNDAVFASFCGYYRRSRLLNENDENIIVNMPLEKQWCIFTLCLIWNAMRPIEGFLQNEMTPSHNCIGDPIPDIPSFVLLEKDGETILSTDPEDVNGRIQKRDQFFQFIARNCQWYLGIPLILLLYAFLKDCYGFFLLKMNDIPVGRLWITGLLCLSVAILYWKVAFRHDAAKYYRFPLKNEACTMEQIPQDDSFSS